MIFPGIQPPKAITVHPMLYLSLVDEGHVYRIGYHAGDELAVLEAICQQVNARRMTWANATALAHQLGVGFAHELTQRRRTFKRERQRANHMSPPP